MAHVKMDILADYMSRRRGERSLREIAKEVGVSAATLSRIENRMAPDLATFVKVCAWLGENPATFFDLEPVSPPLSDTQIQINE
ncbi:hypothetical protein LMG32289_06019 [Cupriavidus pampae]|uniref:HTH cro/C1-type domain-containing protein n=2 Tax=Cupriavidus pampae TaxID=659251 RepID=A0ABN7ZI25_9BURK|nr:hypothetical protein LMG32289_06019 [Cupriavidus pampae]